MWPQVQRGENRKCIERHSFWGLGLKEKAGDLLNLCGYHGPVCLFSCSESGSLLSFPAGSKCKGPYSLRGVERWWEGKMYISSWYLSPI